ncbi:MAG TPA: hypothetical protein PLZ38_12825 [Spirochaetota bacterium]|nr:hypothetical protein [Spirochaetota bacterium]
MKKIFVPILCIIIMAIATGCLHQQLSEDEFTIIWQEYLKREFVESFDEEQSTMQRREILNSVLKDFSINEQSFYNYCRTKHPDKFRLFDIKP